jgi:hypothetical protein
VIQRTAENPDFRTLIMQIWLLRYSRFKQLLYKGIYGLCLAQNIPCTPDPAMKSQERKSRKSSCMMENPSGVMVA